MKHQLLLAAAATACAAFEWENVHIGGGGGFVPGILFHPNAEGVAYARTDIGGLYRWNSDDSWTPLTDNLAFHHNWNRWGIDAVAVDPSDPDVVLAAFGMYTNSWDPNNGAIGRSEDRGETWTFSELPFKVGGNMPGRGMGERLAVDPINSNIVYFGARSGNGLWKSADGGATFEHVTAFPNPGTFIPDPQDQSGYNSDIHGLAFVTFDTTSAPLDGATSRIFVGTADSTAESVYVSEDAGATWSPVASQPIGFLPHKAKLSPEERVLYLTYSDGTGPYDGSDGAVYRYDMATGSWTDITPVSGGDHFFGFGGLALDAQNPGTLVVAALNSWWPDAQLWRSTDSGASWTPIWQWGNYPEMDLRYNISAPKAPWIQTSFLDGVTEKLGWMIESLEINPFDSDHWLYGTGLTIYGGHDLTNWDDADETINIQSLADGIEEFAILSLASAPGGSELLIATYDNSGFTFASADDLDAPPQSTWTNPRFDGSVSVDYAGNDVNRVVQVGNVRGQEQLAVSSDGGFTWGMSPAADTDAAGGTVAYSADGDVILWSTEAVGVRRSQNGGALSSVSSLPARAAIASDKRDNDVFYAGAGGTFYVSTDGGATFVPGGALEGVSQVRYIAAHPAEAGDVWVSTNAGVFHSVDFGETFELAGDITNAFRIALGRGKGEAWNVYAFGIGPAGPKLYGSANGGATWHDVQGEIGFGAIDANALAGSGNHPGLVYVGTNGRGVFWAEGVVGPKC
ncbi:Oligoxyloglucan reducing end-specific cellobiohydrolase [Sodiomyces alkalinus F11]|uniref:Oligoxyloglucan reducing end-specific cellobiohydrolase n=1 Tax=Sodiomyces alkalinus (strain CBS 110278 / VKM F-3762 / F11) TaxID=1314773 RepID=A0A3N2QAK0_SODAK|nr:Oligoxyloglucan reducing end-specific cellobiohydrolase [Sodiomyces alkalinus F11]ROT43774.1 Oligoxyloglucan reducing end-specific cellobiohydrolase [Sodiomyces alkalinus F11]